MARLQLFGGTAVARSVIANNQRCVNYYPETNPDDAPSKVTLYQRPGLWRVAQGPNAPVRALYRASNGNGYCVIGQNVYLIAPDWTLVLLGALDAARTNPCSMIDNGVDIMLVDGSTSGYTINMASNAFAKIVDPSGIFTGATNLAVIDGFILWNVLNSPTFGSTLDNTITFDPLYTAAKNNYPDLLAGLTVVRRQIILLGTLTGEMWFDAGNPLFPFAELPGSAIQHGCAAPYSIATADIACYWLSQDLQGHGYVLRVKGYETTKISTRQITREIQSYPRIDDAIGYTYQMDDHLFYVLHFPSGDATWVWDESEGQWHQEAWTDAGGVLHRHRANCYAFINGVNCVGDWENGALYQMKLAKVGSMADADNAVYLDNVGGVAGPISFIRGFPHFLQAANDMGMQVPSDGDRIRMNQFSLDIECGMGPAAAADGPPPPEVGLRYSYDRGRTVSQTMMQSTGYAGEYLTVPQWQPLGIARDFWFEIVHSISTPAALQGAWVDSELLDS
jgi:hypothetical protein